MGIALFLLCSSVISVVEVKSKDCNKYFLAMHVHVFRFNSIIPIKLFDKGLDKMEFREHFSQVKPFSPTIQRRFQQTDSAACLSLPNLSMLMHFDRNYETAMIWY